MTSRCTATSMQGRCEKDIGHPGPHECASAPDERSPERLGLLALGKLKRENEKLQAENEKLRQEIGELRKCGESLLHAEGLLLRIGYGIANRADAAQAICAWLREHGAQDGWNRPLLDAIGRRMETAPDWPVPPGFKLDSDTNATASDLRETHRDPAGIERSCALDKLARDAMAYAMEDAVHDREDAQGACSCVPGLGFQNYNPTCPRHGH